MNPNFPRNSADYLLVGGGLANSLTALAVLSRRPEARVTLLERGPRLGGNHRWSFHAADVSPSAWPVIAPLVDCRWPGYEVAFQGFRRSIEQAYCSFDSARLDAVVTRRFAESPRATIVTDAEVVEVGEHHAITRDGVRHEGEVVIDARGPNHLGPLPSYFQKFVGLELDVSPEGVPARPTLMDATVPQVDGFRFVYVLPLSPTRVLIEDTYFSPRPDLSTGDLTSGILAYATSVGLSARGVARSETGVIPLPLRGAPAETKRGPIRAGYGGGWFHPVTGYSLPAAARFADVVSSCRPEELWSGPLATLERAHGRQFRFGLFLNRLLYGAFAPADQHHVLERFYRLPEATIQRFYAMALGPADRARMLCGRPPRGFSLSLALARDPS